MFQFSGLRILKEFNYEQNTVKSSCSTVLMGKMWIFGGTRASSAKSYVRQLASVGECGLKSEGTLPFDLDEGAANTVDGSNGAQSALLCFDSYWSTVCHS